MEKTKIRGKKPNETPTQWAQVSLRIRAETKAELVRLASEKGVSVTELLVGSALGRL